MDANARSCLTVCGRNPSNGHGHQNLVRRSFRGRCAGEESGLTAVALLTLLSDGLILNSNQLTASKDFQVEIAAGVPAPTSMLLVGSGVAATITACRRRRRAPA
jgi:hypothetical protein